jgi:hypothetical protein
MSGPSAVADGHPEVSARVRAFIVGCDRSGTSLLRSILNRSPALAIAPETHFLRRLSTTGRSRELSRFQPLADDARVTALAGYLYRGSRRWHAAYWEWLRRSIPEETFTRRLLEAPRTEPAIFALLLELWAESEPGKADALLGEKTPAHLYSVPELLAWYPAARVVHILRDPRAIVASKVEKVRRRGREGPERLVPRPVRGLVRPFTSAIETAHVLREWRDAATLDERYRATYPGRYRLVRFEDLVREPEATIRVVCAHLGVPYDDALVSGVELVGSSFADRHRVAGGFDPASIDRWRRELGPVHARLVTLGTRPWMLRHGYAAR